MTTEASVRCLAAAEIPALVPDLAEVLLDCVARGASVNFMSSLTRGEAEAFWRKVAQAALGDSRSIFVAERGGRVVGTVQLVPASQPNQPHRADIAKLLVHGEARRGGLGAALMAAAEAKARATGKTLLTLDTITDSAADRLYRRLGFTLAGRIPDYALLPDGTPGETSLFYKTLR